MVYVNAHFNSQLDAKWLLEHQLEQNRARRAQVAAQTEVASNKRKLESAREAESAEPKVQQVEENSAKWIKVQHSPDENAFCANGTPEVPTKDVQSSEHAEIKEDSIPDVNTLSIAKADGTAQREPDEKESAQPAGIQEESSKEVEQITPPEEAAPPQQLLTQQNEQPERTVSDGDMNFESMFGDINAGNDQTNDQTNDLNFDLDLNPQSLAVSNPLDSATHNASNLELLPGLESYANASGDEFNMLDLPSTTNDQTGTQAVNYSLDLPEIQDDTNFNDLFADGDFGADASLMDLDLEDGFF